MRIRVYGAQQNELPLYRDAESKYGFTFEFAAEPLNENNAAEVQNCEGLIVLTNCQVSDSVACILAGNGVRYIATRSAGYDHIDYEAVIRRGMRAARVPFYSPQAIAEHTVLLALSLIRNIKRADRKIAMGDYTLRGLQGRELGSMTAGVLGTGRIGRTTMQLLNGFGARVLGWDPYPNKAAESLCTYTSMDKLLQESDMIFLHCPLTDDNYHLINTAVLEQMKSEAYLVNTARGGLVDHDAVLRALDSGHLAGFAFDVYENESIYLRKQVDPAILDPTFEHLIAREDTIYTAHMAFYTDNAIRNMIEVTLENMHEYDVSGECRNEIA